MILIIALIITHTVILLIPDIQHYSNIIETIEIILSVELLGLTLLIEALYVTFLKDNSLLTQTFAHLCIKVGLLIIALNASAVNIPDEHTITSKTMTVPFLKTETTSIFKSKLLNTMAVK